MNVLLEPSSINKEAYICAYMGVVASLVFANIGAAFATAKIGIAIYSLQLTCLKHWIESFVPIVISGVIGIYGLIVSVAISQQVKNELTFKAGFAMLASGLVCGLSSLAGGIAIGFIGDVGVKAVRRQEKMYTWFILLLIFAESIGLYGLIVALLILDSK